MNPPIGHNVDVWSVDDQHVMTERVEDGTLELWTWTQPWPSASSVHLPHISMDGQPLYYIGKMH